MRLRLLIPACPVLLLLAACGNSTPLPPTPAASAPASAPGASAQAAPAKRAYTASVGAFAAVPPTLVQQTVRVTHDCNLDTVDGKAPGSVVLQHAGNAAFAGWAADTATGTVPATLQLVLTGARDYAVAVATGFARADVAAAQHKPGFAAAGYQVKADLSAVAAGDYGVTLVYNVAGQALRCPTKLKLSVQ